MAKVVETLESLPHTTESRRSEEVICKELLDIFSNSASLAFANGLTPVTSPSARRLADEIEIDASPYALGLKATAEGRFDDARHFFELAEEGASIDPVTLYTARAQLENLAGDPLAAVHWMKKAIELKPHDSTLIWSLALALCGACQ